MQPTPACEPLTALPFNAPPAKLSMIIKLQSSKVRDSKEGSCVNRFLAFMVSGSVLSIGKNSWKSQRGFNYWIPMHCILSTVPQEQGGLIPDVVALQFVCLCEEILIMSQAVFSKTPLPQAHTCHTRHTRTHQKSSLGFHQSMQNAGHNWAVK